MRVLGIDAGGTKTVCLLADGDGTIVSEGRGTGANLQTAGPRAVEQVLRGVVAQVLDGEGTASLAATCVGVAGGDRPNDIETMTAVLRRLGLDRNVLIVNDALVALTAGIGDAPGLVVVSGTGSIAYARDTQGRASRAGGWGHIIGDEGSGFWLGRSALTAVARHVDGRGPETVLTRLLPSSLGLAGPADLIAVVYEGGVDPAAVARLAAVVQRGADENDVVCRALIDEAVADLAAAAAAALDRLGMRDTAFATVLAGGAFRSVPSLVDRIRRELARVAPASDVRLLEGQPAQGAVHMALAFTRGTLQLPRLV